jgi:NAD(P)-dependent dehydrogenase (short-subunit alcohol dehydrogenase family)
MGVPESRVVVVTGAAGNLGEAVARAFAHLGDSLILVDRAAGRLEVIFPDLADSDRHLFAEKVDLTQDHDVDAMISSALARFGRIDVLVNAAGGWRGGKPVHETDPNTWSFLLDLNAKSVYLVARAVVPHMLEQQHGRIINVAARAGVKGLARSGVYSASKGAVIRLTESLSAELKSHGINVNCVLPGTIDTPQNRAAMPKANSRLWVEPEAIADVIVFLASDAARALHGTAIPVNGLG